MGPTRRDAKRQGERGQGERTTGERVQRDSDRDDHREDASPVEQRSSADPRTIPEDQREQPQGVGASRNIGSYHYPQPQVRGNTGLSESIGLSARVVDFLRIEPDDFRGYGSFLNRYPEIIKENTEALAQTISLLYNRDDHDRADRYMQNYVLLHACNNPRRLAGDEARRYCNFLAEGGAPLAKFKQLVNSYRMDYRRRASTTLRYDTRHAVTGGPTQQPRPEISSGRTRSTNTIPQSDPIPIPGVARPGGNGDHASIGSHRGTMEHDPRTIPRTGNISQSQSSYNAPERLPRRSTMDASNIVPNRQSHLESGMSVPTRTPQASAPGLMQPSSRASEYDDVMRTADRLVNMTVAQANQSYGGQIDDTHSIGSLDRQSSMSVADRQGAPRQNARPPTSRYIDDRTGASIVSNNSRSRRGTMEQDEVPFNRRASMLVSNNSRQTGPERRGGNLSHGTMASGRDLRQTGTTQTQPLQGQVQYTAYQIPLVPGQGNPNNTMSQHQPHYTTPQAALVQGDGNPNTVMSHNQTQYGTSQAPLVSNNPPPFASPPTEAHNSSSRSLQLYDDQPTIGQHGTIEIRAGNAVAPSSEYQIQPPRNAHNFFRVGRVLRVAWHTTAGSNLDGDPNDAENVTTTADGLRIHTKHMYMLVIARKNGYSICCPIQTYKGLGVAKPGLKGAEIRAHAIIHTKGRKAQPTKGEPNMGKRSIPVKMAPNRPALSAASRVHFGKFHTLEWNVPVLNVGVVDDGYEEIIRNCFISEFFGS